MVGSSNVVRTILLHMKRRRARRVATADEEDKMFEMMQAMQSQGCERPQWGGSVPGHIVIDRDHAGGHARIIADYFSEHPVYTDTQFRRRYRMRRPLFLRIMATVEENDPWFTCRPNATGKMGLSSFQKCIAALRILAYGVPADAVDEYVSISESSATEALARFCKAVVNVFEEQYLRPPTEADLRHILHTNEQRGFPGMLGSIDCMHWEWKNCPTAWKGMFTGRGKHPSMILEALDTHDLWIWHAYFEMSGSNNDINVLHRSPLFARQVRGEAPDVEFTVNGTKYHQVYYLADGIYPEWFAFVKTYHRPIAAKERCFARFQESVHKDIERAFGVLQSRWAVIRGPAYGWSRMNLKYIIMACIILHNMLVDDERGERLPLSYDSNGAQVVPFVGRTREKHDFIAAHHELRNREVHNQLKADLMDHIWARHGSI